MSKGRAFLLGGFWTVSATVIGLSPLWLKCILCKVIAYPHGWSNMIREGSVMLFAMTLVGTVLVDLLLMDKERTNLPREVKVIIYVLVPFFVFTCVAASFGVLVKDPQVTNVKVLGHTQTVAFALALLYSVSVKTIRFLKEPV